VVKGPVRNFKDIHLRLAGCPSRGILPRVDGAEAEQDSDKRKLDLQGALPNHRQTAPPTGFQIARPPTIVLYAPWTMVIVGNRGDVRRRRMPFAKQISRVNQPKAAIDYCDPVRKAVKAKPYPIL
jgi:hypothetical protein